MKITVVCDVLGEENNGTTIAAMNLIRYLQSRGHEVRIVCPDKDKKDAKGYYVVPTLNLGIFNNYIKKNGVVISKADTMILARAIKDADVIHIMLPFSLGRRTAKIAQKMHKPLTAGFHAQAENLTNHVFLMNAGIANLLVYKNFYSHFYRYIDCVHYPTEFIKNVFESKTHKTNAYVISNGVVSSFVKKEVARPPEFKDRYLILFTGRYSKEKSHHVLIDAIKHSKYKDKIQLIFAGEGPQKKKIEKLGSELPLHPIMKFFSHEEIINMINMSDLYVHPAEIEIEAISCLEAISCGLVPVISDSKRSATRFFALDEKNLFENRNSHDLARKIDYWLEHPQEKIKRSEDYLGYTKQFSRDLCMKRMEEMLYDAIRISKEKFAKIEQQNKK
ncbi:MAG: glycosyltransferase [Bacilli bacterium]|jgi:glycosyltransferase involved in cell wall biosynthesis